MVVPPLRRKKRGKTATNREIQHREARPAGANSFSFRGANSGMQCPGGERHETELTEKEVGIKKKQVGSFVGASRVKGE